jgi:hypothetical protein
MIVLRNLDNTVYTACLAEYYLIFNVVNLLIFIRVYAFPVLTLTTSKNCQTELSESQQGAQLRPHQQAFQAQYNGKIHFL